MRSSHAREAMEDKGSCPYKTWDGKGHCGRSIHKTSPGIDARPVCLMHSRDPDKSVRAMQDEVQKILDDAADTTADFSYFVFPRLVGLPREIRPRCVYRGAAFTGEAIFGSKVFIRGADFAHATFAEPADFYGAEFGATGFGAADFKFAKFMQDADFSQSVFAGTAFFGDAAFGLDARFFNSTFVDLVHFGDATFNGVANFERARFGTCAVFSRANFLGPVRFGRSRFRGDPAMPRDLLGDSRVGQIAGSLESGSAAEPGIPEKLQAGPVFTLARFDKPEAVLFQGNCLKQALFFSCDVSQFSFSDVVWPGRPGIRKCMVFEERVSLDEFHAAPLKPEAGANERNYVLIAELYQQLKKNYDSRCDYWSAGDFHYGELEMKRLASPRQSRLLPWLHKHFGLVALYKYASQYGESYSRPVLWLVPVLFLFMMLYPAVGLRYNAQAQNTTVRQAAGDAAPLIVSYRSRCGVPTDSSPRCMGYPELLGHSLMATLYLAAFQKDLVYEPAYPWGRILALLEVLLTSTLVALFLLAVRRQFRR